MLEDTQLDHSILASIGNAIAWIFTPLGWGDWKAAVAAITGLVAKENVVGTFGILYGFAEVADDGAEIWGTLAASYTQIAAFSFLIFNLLCAPCFAAMGAIKREMNNGRWTAFAIVYQIGNLVITGTFTFATVIAILVVIGFVYLLVRPYKEDNRLNIDLNKTVTEK